MDDFVTQNQQIYTFFSKSIYNFFFEIIPDERNWVSG